MCRHAPHFYRKSKKRLAHLQKMLSKRKGSRKGEVESNNHKKQKLKVAKLSHHVANQRKDFLHKLSNERTNHYGVICVEDLNMQSLSHKGLRNGKATMDNAYGMFINMLKYKQKRLGHHLIKVDKLYPSTQLCFDCGFQNTELKGIENLSIRKWTCPECGAEHDRDINAAKNILAEGLCMLTKDCNMYKKYRVGTTQL